VFAVALWFDTAIGNTQLFGLVQINELLDGLIGRASPVPPVNVDMVILGANMGQERRKAVGMQARIAAPMYPQTTCLLRRARLPRT